MSETGRKLKFEAYGSWIARFILSRGSDERGWGIVKIFHAI